MKSQSTFYRYITHDYVLMRYLDTSPKAVGMQYFTQKVSQLHSAAALMCRFGYLPQREEGSTISAWSLGPLKPKSKKKERIN